MPVYQYACTECGEQLEARQSFTDESLTVCPSCGGRLRKVLSAVGVVFKGSGFYRTDSRKEVAAASADSSGTSKDASGTGSSSSGTGKGSSESGSSGKGSSESDSAPAELSDPARRHELVRLRLVRLGLVRLRSGLQVRHKRRRQLTLSPNRQKVEREPSESRARSVK